MEASPFISIIICTYNRADYLRDTLISLFQTNASAAQFEVLIVDNNSSDQTRNMVQKLTKQYADFRLYYIKETKQGLSYARNRGIMKSTAPVILFLDDDITLHPDFIPAWLRFLNNYPEAAGGGGKIHVQFDDPRPAWMSRFLLPLLGHHDLGNTIKKYPSNKYPFGGNMAFRKKIFDQYGLFNPNLGRKGSILLAGEEKEFYNRLDNAGNIYYLPDAFLFHRVNSQRLTKEYIKNQAVGLGKSIAYQTKGSSFATKLVSLSSELFKIGATLLLIIGYSITLQIPKAVMLYKFRRWIWQGYHQSDLHS